MEPYQRVGYAITIGDGAYVRDWPSSYSVITAELPGNKVVYVHGQTYVDQVAWHEVQFDGDEWGYIRADMLRMLRSSEVISYLNELNATPQPYEEVTTPPYNGNSMSSYGYVSAATVNFRTQPSTGSERIRQLKKYALCLVLGTEQVNGITWYRVGYDGKTGYISGEYFKQMTLTEMEQFLESPEYTEGIANNRTTTATASPSGASGSSSSGSGSSGASGSSATPTTRITSAEDERVSTWVNPNSTVTASYEPFDPFATPEPVNENAPQNTEYLDTLVTRMKEGTLTEEGLDTTLRVAYKDAENAEETIEKAKAYIKEKLGAEATEEPTATPEAIPLATEEVYPQEESGSSPLGWMIGIVALLGAGAGGYFWYTTQQKRRAAQITAQKRAAQAKKQQAGGKPGSSGAAAGSAAAAQGQRRPDQTDRKAPAGVQRKQEAGTETASREKNGVVSAQSALRSKANARKAYGKPMENPYARYSAGGEEDASYTASFRPTDSESGKDDLVPGTAERNNEALSATENEVASAPETAGENAKPRRRRSERNGQQGPEV